MKICIANNINEPKERRKRKFPLRCGRGDINSINSTIQDEYRDNSSIKERFVENYLAIIVLCEKLFLTKTFSVEDELKCYDDLRGEQRLYKVALDETKEFNLSTSTKFSSVTCNNE
jgi:hypothetical protein